MLLKPLRRFLMGTETKTRTWWTKTAFIKEKFPNPSRGGPVHKNSDYCVGGAFLRYHHLNGGFPSADELTSGLVKVNSDLPRDHAWRLANDIIAQNDTGDFCEAWQTLERALMY
jgi:hypothetical protein